MAVTMVMTIFFFCLTKHFGSDQYSHCAGRLLTAAGIIIMSQHDSL